MQALHRKKGYRNFEYLQYVCMKKTKSKLFNCLFYIVYIFLFYMVQYLVVFDSSISVFVSLSYTD